MKYRQISSETHSVFLVLLFLLALSDQGMTRPPRQMLSVQIPSRAGSKGKCERDEGPGSGGLPAGGFKHSGCSEVLLATFFFSFCTKVEMEGMCWKEVVWLVSMRVNAPVNVFHVRIYQSRWTD